MLGRTDRRLRLIVLLVCFVALSMAAVVRLSEWQIARGAELRQRASQQLGRAAEEAPLRGRILDRHGVVLATTTYVDVLAAYPDLIDSGSLDQTVAGLAVALSLDEAAVVELRAKLGADDPYVVVSRRLTREQSATIRAGMSSVDTAQRLEGLVLEPRPVRDYPNPGGAPGTTLASQLLGFVTEDGQGHYGIEGYYDEVLSGEPTRLASSDDLGSRPLPLSAQEAAAGTGGADVKLTIDASLQLQLERELFAAWVANKAKRVSAVVLDPDGGEVLAWASVPGYDGTQAAAVAASTPELLPDPIASAVYEPGSVMKMFTATAALDAGVIGLEDKVLDSWGLTFGPSIIHNADLQAMGRIPFKDVIAYSRNVAMARVALDLDDTVPQAAQRLYSTWQRFGLGERTGIDLANEGVGLVSDPAVREWEPIDLANRAFGQGIGVTQVQLGVAYAAMINGGMKVTPHLVSEVGGLERTWSAPERILDAGLATDLRTVLEYVTQRVPWYRAGTEIPGYVVGGKTGTAQIWDAEQSRWLPDTYNFSFAGFVGTHKPEAVIVTRIEEAVPRILRPGVVELGIMSYELFRRMAIDTMTSLEVPPLPIPPDVEPGIEVDGNREDPAPDASTEPDPGG